MLQFDKELFKQRLSETVTWCSGQDLSDYGKHSLRRVPLLLPEARCLPFEDAKLTPLVDSLFSMRTDLLRQQEIPSPAFTQSLQGGQLIVFRPNVAYAMDGVMESVSHGFFEYCDFPAWDTWVYYVSEENNELDDLPNNYLISFVPQVLISNVREAMEDSCDSWSTRWFPEISIDDPDFLSKLVNYLET